MYVSTKNGDYWVETSGEGTPILLLHGFTGSSKTWDLFVEKWKKAYKLIVLDLPGHGKTNIDKLVSMEDCCADLETILNELNLDKVNLLGYSMGGRTALSFAMLYTERVASVILESASPGLAESHEQISRQAKDEQLAAWMEQNELSDFVKYWENLDLFKTQKKLTSNVQANIRSERLNQSKQGLVHSLRGMGTGKQPSWWDQLANFSLPVLILVGQEDDKFVKLGKHMDESLKYSQYKVIKNVGHAVHVEQPEIFGTIVSDFINQLSE
ncbi:2-succinyl-6-hydroxy-2,4-cyclohexadiene-1-carboxylate synthase [Aquibacillus kalidii]|uniref:2-succinyl-6-hydroxy-2, 4-cyclohexadiene-1-carboxylate synthase n=1 Tax=Aquibacillus kalidii TaxID=2762597 RepID=UPI001648F4A4|nr:2-succinyl-6-hydroxy-2,4-cyclohexadiene-1-carboxylate synthase [Aquibacillus kalidii]